MLLVQMDSYEKTCQFFKKLALVPRGLRGEGGGDASFDVLIDCANGEKEGGSVTKRGRKKKKKKRSSKKTCSPPLSPLFFPERSVNFLNRLFLPGVLCKGKKEGGGK